MMSDSDSSNIIYLGSQTRPYGTSRPPQAAPNAEDNKVDVPRGVPRPKASGSGAPVSAKRSRAKRAEIEAGQTVGSGSRASLPDVNNEIPLFGPGASDTDIDVGSRTFPLLSWYDNPPVQHGWTLTVEIPYVPPERLVHYVQFPPTSEPPWAGPDRIPPTPPTTMPENNRDRAMSSMSPFVGGDILPTINSPPVDSEGDEDMAEDALLQDEDEQTPFERPQRSSSHSPERPPRIRLIFDAAVTGPSHRPVDPVVPEYEYGEGGRNEAVADGKTESADIGFEYGAGEGSEAHEYASSGTGEQYDADEGDSDGDNDDENQVGGGDKEDDEVVSRGTPNRKMDLRGYAERREASKRAMRTRLRGDMRQVSQSSFIPSQPIL
jgi:hypothetical protein